MPQEGTMYGFCLLLLYLALYSFLGWVAEVLYVLARSHHLTNRGFLTGPFVPIYGVGALFLIVLVDPYIQNPFLVFAASVLITSALEYVTHLLLDKLFHVRLWDYSSRPFNLHGRICLQNSLLFGMLGLLLIYVIHPFATGLLRAVPSDAVIAVGWMLVGILLVDAMHSILTLAKLRPVLDEARGSLEQVRHRVEAASVTVGADVDQRRAELQRVNPAKLRLLTRAFPHARSTRSAPAPAPAD